MQIDVVAVDFRGRHILLGEAKIRDLISRAPRVMPLDGWQVRYAFFAREGFTEAAQHGALLRTLQEMEPDLT